MFLESIVMFLSFLNFSWFGKISKGFEAVLSNRSVIQIRKNDLNEKKMSKISRPETTKAKLKLNFLKVAWRIRHFIFLFVWKQKNQWKKYLCTELLTFRQLIFSFCSSSSSITLRSSFICLNGWWITTQKKKESNFPTQKIAQRFSFFLLTLS